MMRVQDIGQDYHQRHTIFFDDLQADIVLHFHPARELWTMDLHFLGTDYFGEALKEGDVLFNSYNLPFAFAIFVEDGSGIDPLTNSCFSSGRCSLWALGKEEMKALRGYEVPDV